MFGWNGMLLVRRPAKSRTAARPVPPARAAASSLPRAEPMQKWMPLPNASVRRALARSHVERVSGSGNTDASRPVAASHRKSFAPAGISTPPTSRPAWSPAARPRRTGRSAASRRPPRDQRRVGDDRLPSAPGPRAGAARSCRSGCWSSRARRTDSENRIDAISSWVSASGSSSWIVQQRAREVVAAVGRPCAATSSRR